MTNISIQDAALLAQQAYDPRRYPSVSAKISRTLDKGDVQAVMLNDGTLLIAGSNSIADYAKFNMQAFKVLGQRFQILDGDTEKGASRTRWHQGFLTHAKVIYDFVGAQVPRLISGHSLGAASAQILCKTWGVPAVGFASPRPHFGKGRLKNEGGMLNICRTDDSVCFVPPGFRRLGKTIMLKPQQPHHGLDHSMENYIGMLKFDILGMPAQWP